MNLRIHVIAAALLVALLASVDSSIDNSPASKV